MTIRTAIKGLLKAVVITGLSALVLACLGILGFVISLAVSKHNREMAFRETLSPLSPETKEDLCSIFELDPIDRRCKLSKDIYSYQFYDEIVLRYFKDRPNTDSTRPTYEEIEKLFGKYNQGCTYYEEYNDTFCYYDFSGKNEEPIMLYFDENGILQSFNTRHLGD